MALISRVSRLLRADLNAVLDHLEEPDVLLRQAVREMEQALGADDERLERLRHDHEHLLRRARELEQALAGIDGELDLCFAAQEHDLARALCRRKLETTHLLDTVSRRGDDTARELAALEERCRAQRLRFESMRHEADLLGAEPAAPGDGAAVPPAVSCDDVAIAFLREQRKRGGA
jgi:phage shock protein A